MPPGSGATKSPSFQFRSSRSLSSRALGLLWRNPWLIQTKLRENYRRQVGIGLDRRFRDGLSGPPVNFSLNLTRRCNLKCVMCEQNRHRPGAAAGLSWYDPRRELPLAAWTKFLDQVAYFRPNLYLTGGEPLLYAEFQGLIRQAKKRKFLVQLQTNGTLLDRVADLLVSEGVELVTISLDGPPEAHDRIRGQAGAFHRTRQGIAALLEARQRHRRPGPLVQLNCVISKGNLAALEEMVPLAQDLGADLLQLQHTMFNNAANVARHNHLLNPEFAGRRGLDLVFPSIPEGEYYESELTADDLAELRAALGRARRLATGRLKLLFMPNLPEELLAPYYLNLDHPFPQVCQALWKGCRILPDGTVSPCLHVVAGNIATQPFTEIWNGPRMQRFRQIIARRLFPGCARCCSRSFT